MKNNGIYEPTNDANLRTCIADFIKYLTTNEGEREVWIQEGLRCMKLMEGVKRVNQRFINGGKGENTGGTKDLKELIEKIQICKEACLGVARGDDHS